MGGSISNVTQPDPTNPAKVDAEPTQGGVSARVGVPVEVVDGGGPLVPRSLAQAAAYAWRILAVLALLYVVLSVLGQLELLIIAVFVGLIIAALLGPIVDSLARIMPTPLAVAAGLILMLAFLVAVVAFIAGSVSGSWDSLTAQFETGIGELQGLLQGPPFNLSTDDFATWFQNAEQWLVDNRGELAAGAVGSAGRVVEVVAVLALALFTAVCFLSGGSGIWQWSLRVFPQPTRARVDGAGLVAWRSFAGYTRGIIVVAASNAAFVCILLLVLRVPLALPLALIVFFGSFIPLIGAPIAMVIAAFVALAANGPIVAMVVLVGIALLGQFEGHVLQPLVMSKAVNIHPLAVALSVAAGTLLAGLFGAVIAVPVVSVCYGVIKFWNQTRPAPDPDAPLPGTPASSTR